MVNVRNITFSYPHAPEPVLEQVGFDIAAGECMAILGNNGAGKSTLLKCVDRICRAPEATVLVDGKNVFSMNGRTMAQHVAYVPQSVAAMDMTVFDAVLLGRKPYIRWDATAEDREIAGRVLHQMGLDSYALRNVSELSGGEAQKVMLARALAQEPRLLLLDEPTSSLDPRNQHEVLHLVRRLARAHQISVAVILHDLNLALRYCDKFLFLKGSRVYAYGGMEILSPALLEEVYGMRAQIIQYDGVPLVVPFPEEERERPDRTA